LYRIRSLSHYALPTGTGPNPELTGLAQQLAALDPIALAHDIERTLDRLWKLADTRRTTLEEAARG